MGPIFLLGPFFQPTLFSPPLAVDPWSPASDPKLVLRPYSCMPLPTLSAELARGPRTCLRGAVGGHINF